MKYLLPLVALLALLGCDSQQSPLDAATAEIYIGDQRLEASAVLSTRELDGTAYQVVSLETAAGNRIELLGLAFEKGQFVKQHAANMSFPFLFSYLESGTKRHYAGTTGAVEIDVATLTMIEGTFEFETVNVLSSSMRTGPQVTGRFRAVRD